MSGYSTSCPSCGAPVEFTLGRTLLTVCSHCSSAVARVGARVEDYGKVAELIPTPSLLRLGLEGRDAEHGRFELVGRVQLDAGNGTWDEWHAVFSDGSAGWLAEAQGKFYLTREVDLPPLPPFAEHDPGETVDLGASGTFVVAEVHEAEFRSAEGELPFAVEPGAKLRFVDLSGPKDAFGTLDYGAGEAAQAVFVGHERRLDELGFSPADLPSEAERRVATTSRSLDCPRCSGSLELRAPDETRRIGCPYCGSLLELGDGLQVLATESSLRVQPLIPLGSKGRLAGVPWTVIGHLVRSVRVDGIRYPWQEYLLHEPRRGFRWLAYSKGHWSFVEPVSPGDVAVSGSRRRHGGRSFKHFQGGRAVVDQVIGEFYWEVQQGETVSTNDYVSPPFVLTEERSSREVQWGLGRYLEPQEVRSAFGIERLMPMRSGVAPGQPCPHAPRAKSAWQTAAVAGALLLLLATVFSASSKQHFETSFTTPAGREPRVDEIFLSEPFELGRQTSLQVKLQADVNNSWAWFEGALINQTAGEIRPFTTELAYYHGRSGGDSWSEGRRSRTLNFPALEPGGYLLRLAPQGEAGKGDKITRVTVTSGAPRLAHFVLALLALFAWPLLCSVMWWSFESRRWQESDHPWGAQ